MISYLRVKIKTLSAEVTAIRQEERKVRNLARKRRGKQGQEQRVAAYELLRHDLYEHRFFKVRPEVRAAHLAHMFLVNKPYRLVERDARRKLDVDAIARNVKRFADTNIPFDEYAVLVEQWLGKDAPQA